MESREQQLEQQLRDLQARVGGTGPVNPAPVMQPQFAPAPPQPQSWGQPNGMQPAMPAMQPMGIQAQPKGLLVAVNIPTPEGDATCYLEFGPEAMANPQAVVMQLLQQGWPVKIWRQSNGGGGGYGGGGGGGYGGGAGGSRFGGGGFNRGRRW